MSTEGSGTPRRPNGAVGETFEILQEAVERKDFVALSEALAEKAPIDARDLDLSESQLSSLIALLPLDPDGASTFYRWRMRGTRFGDGCDFSGCAFYACDFAGCRFGDSVSFNRARFNPARFTRARFGDEVLLENVDFGVKAEFGEASFGDRARLGYSHFGSAQFAMARFGESAGFARTHFAARARFHNARFGARASFTESRFDGGCDFGGVDFGEKLQMIRVDFGGPVSLNGAAVGARARLIGWQVQGSLVMRSARFHGDMSMHGASVIAGNADFEHARFHGSVDLGEVEVSGDVTFSHATLYAADRIGPLTARALRFDGATLHTPCVLEASAAIVDLSEARFLAPVRVELARGDLIVDRLDTRSRLVLMAAEQADGPPPRLVSAQGADVSSTVVTGLDVKALRLQGAAGIDRLQLETGVGFEACPQGFRAHREAIAEEHQMRDERHPGRGWFPPACRYKSARVEPRIAEMELARIYRSLRKAREDSRDAPGAADFYYGEMEMRRLATKREHARARNVGPRLLEAGNMLLLELYRLIGGYGVRPSRPLLIFAAALLGGALYVESAGVVHHAEVTGTGAVRSGGVLGLSGAFVFVLRSALLLQTSTGVVLSTSGEWVQIVARILGPVLLGLFAFAVRARVHR